MRAVYVAVSLLFVLAVNAQDPTEFEYQLALGKAEFKKDFDQQNFVRAVSSLEQAVSLNPESAEAWYFLGYAYSRLNAKDGQGITDMDLKLTLKTSQALEKVNALTPKYTGEMVIQDPYSKLSAEWGSLGMNYWYHNQPDSARWAYNEGKRRGGFGDFLLEMNRAILDACPLNSILVSSGDNFTIVLWYLQQVESYRTDVTVVDVTLLNAGWYPEYLIDREGLDFGITRSELNSLEYMRWADSTISINDFSWTVKPSYQDHYVLRGNRLLLHLLTTHAAMRNFYFTVGIQKKSLLNLDEYMTSYIVVNELTLGRPTSMDFSTYQNTAKQLLRAGKQVNLNSSGETQVYSNIRYGVLKAVQDALEVGDKEKARKLMALYDNYNESRVPLRDEKLNEYIAYFRSKL